MTADEAARWHGYTLRFGEREAVSGTDTCPDPEYREREAPADSLLAADYRVTPAGLGLESSPGLRLQVMDIHCGGEPWGAPGGHLLWVSRARGFAVRDGAFLELGPAAAVKP